MEPLLRLEGITKAFAGVPVLDDVSFEVAAGEVHALIGENGAGKSTLMKIATGALEPDSGRIFWKGREVLLKSPRQAHALGLAIVHQELMLVPSLSVSENIFLGRHPARRGLFRWVRWSQMHERARELLRALGHDLDPRRPVGELRIAEQQLVEIARALAFEADLIIMDEPTSPLSEHETQKLFGTIRQLKERGVSIVYISHRLREIYDIADRVTVLRDGRRVATARVAETTPDDLVRWMVGREISQHFPAPSTRPVATEVLRVEGLTARGKFSDISFTLRRGEILGIAGLVGAGRTELLEALFAAPPPDAGRIYLNGRPVRFRTPVDAVRHGLALVTDDRKTKGLVLGGSVRFNIELAVKDRLAWLGLILPPTRERELAQQFVRELRIKTRHIEEPVIYLSGGNQQKVVLARWLAADSLIFLLDEPTRGIDVGSKAEIYDLIRQLAARGAAILLVSSELEEILHLADRILVMHRGRIVGELQRQEATEERIMQLATGANDASPNSISA
ncbi:MAG TPA: sugar ABC transporter ATP-binding protein [Blastocatellia bacterium]|nr:sugar ABC transporter ATP-binding protein [Blastocatellia bacterium]